MKWANVSNKEGGCLGMCAQPVHYRCEIQQNIPGTENFVSCHKVLGAYSMASVTMTEQLVPLSKLCNAEKNLRIRFALISTVTNKELNHVETSLSSLQEGENNLTAAKNGTTL